MTKTKEIAVNCAHDELVPLHKLVPNPRNPNTHSEEQIRLLAKVIDYQGWRNPIVVSNRSGFIVKGHARLASAKRLGLTEAPVDNQDYDSEAQEWADLLADNRLAELAEIDKRVLKDLIEEMDTGAVDMELTGYTEQAIEAMMTATVPDKPEIPFTPELWESHNYIVLYFDNDIDWVAAQDVFGLKRVKTPDSRKGYESVGIGRVLNGADIMRKVVE